MNLFLVVTVMEKCVIIIGGGSMGRAAAWFLSKAKVKTIMIDPLQAPHENGSHSGYTRIIRKSYFEHLDYVPLLKRSYYWWRQLESNSKIKIYTETGIDYYGEKSSSILKGIKYASDKYGIPLFHKRQQGYFRTPGDWEQWFEPEAGYLNVQAAFEAFRVSSNSQYLTHIREKAISWKIIGDYVEVKTASNTFTGEKIIISSGAWTNNFIGDSPVSLRTTKQVLAFVHLTDEQTFPFAHMPCWFIHDPEKGMYYGFTMDQSIHQGLKIALHMPGESINPNALSDDINFSEKNKIIYFMETYLPELKYTSIDYKVCLYTYSADENFIIDFLPQTDKKVILSTGFSGHGFKFAPVIGEIISKMAMNESHDFNLGFLKLNRFAV